MNNKQLDMVLKYLNEGTEIDKDEFLNEKVVYSGKELKELITSIGRKLRKLKSIKSAKFSEYHGSSLDIELNEELNDSSFAPIKNIIKTEVSIFEKKFNCEYSWSVKVANQFDCLIVFDCDIK